MTEARAALLARFRETLRARLQRIAVSFRESRRDEAWVELHTLKGEARMLGLSKLATLAHELESSLAEHSLLVDHSRALDEMRRALDENAGPAARADSGAERERIQTMLAEWARHAQALAGESGKLLHVAVRAEDGIGVETLEGLWPALVHLLRNALDHGLELPHERADKPPEGYLGLSAELRGSRSVFTVEDDGRGIDPEAIRAIATRRGVHDAPRLDRGELLELLLQSGFSTRREVTELSGRGVGLDAARRQIEALGGRITVETEPGRGTRFVISVPRAPSAR